MTGTSWESRLLELFDDLEQQAAGLDLVERELQVSDLAQSEYAQVTLADRLRAAVGVEVTLLLPAGLQVRGVLTRSGEGWVVLRDAGDAAWVVPTPHLLGVGGLGPRAAHPSTGSVADRLPLRALLRRVAEEGRSCLLHLRDGSRREGVLRRVGHDFVEIDAAASTVLVPAEALVALRWTP